MNISIIAAMSKNHVIGVNGKLPWHLPDDLKWFKQNTIGKPIIMGKNTFLSIGTPLPKRENIILTSDKDFIQPGCLIFNDLQKALNYCKDHDEIMIIGGETLYRQTLPISNKLYLTLIEQNFDGDTFFPEYSKEKWAEVFSTLNIDNIDSTIQYKHIILERR